MILYPLLIFILMLRMIELKMCIWKHTQELRKESDIYGTKAKKWQYVSKVIDEVMEKYNYKFDPKFWFNIFDYSIKNGVIENREMQRLISNRIIENNHHYIKYQLFGYSFSRMRNGQIYMEHDILVQTFTMGYIGLVLLIGPYLVVVGIISIKVLKKMKRKIALFNITFLISIYATLGTSILTGHILDELFITIYIGFICGYFLQKIEKKKEAKNES